MNMNVFYVSSDSKLLLFCPGLSLHMLLAGHKTLFSLLLRMTFI